MTTTGVGEGFEAQRTRDLSLSLEVLGRQLPVLLDLIGMNDTRQSFLSSWEVFAGDLSATEGTDDGINQYLVSQPLELIDDILQVLGAGSKGVLGGDPAGIQILEHVLRSTPRILRARNVVPEKESHVKQVLHEHMESTFSDYSSKVSLPKGLKSFVPDGAIPSLEVLIEIKFVDSRRKVGPIFSGIMEDLSGYGGSRDWTRFYSVVYQTEEFINEGRFDRSLRLSGNAGRWRPIVVSGPGGRSPAPRQGKLQNGTSRQRAKPL
jgi:hypothetical protein